MNESINFSFLDNQNGISQYIVCNHADVVKVHIPDDIKSGDTFTATLKNNDFISMIYQGELLTSLDDPQYKINDYKIRYNPLFSEYQISHPEIGACESFSDLLLAKGNVIKG